MNAGGVLIEGAITSGRVTFGVVTIERSITVGSVEAAFRVVGERISANGIVVPPVDIAIECINAVRGVVAAAGVAEQRSNTSRRIVLAGSVVIERLETKAAVPDPAGQTNKHPTAIGCVAIGQNAVQICSLRSG